MMDPLPHTERVARERRYSPSFPSVLDLSANRNTPLPATIRDTQPSTCALKSRRLLALGYRAHRRTGRGHVLPRDTF